MCIKEFWRGASILHADGYDKNRQYHSCKSGSVRFISGHALQSTSTSRPVSKSLLLHSRPDEDKAIAKHDNRYGSQHCEQPGVAPTNIETIYTDIADRRALVFHRKVTTNDFQNVRQCPYRVLQCAVSTGGRP